MTGPDILLITLDTTRADALGWGGAESLTPHLDALATRGTSFELALTTAPTTLPAHTSMLSGKYPSEHGVHENSRPVAEEEVLLASLLSEAGYRTAAFVSGFPLAREFGLAKGFDLYDDTFGFDASGREKAERKANETTNRVLDLLTTLDPAGRPPLFLWVHYYDAHAPYVPPEPFRSSAPSHYLGEVAFVDREIGRLLASFEAASDGRAKKFLVVGDHGEGLGDHGESLHGNLLYQAVMRVPLILAGTDVPPRGRVAYPVSTRRVFDTVLEWAGIGVAGQLDALLPAAAAGHRDELEQEVVLGEAMKPFLQYGWQPQVMALWGNQKAIFAGELEVYDLALDPGERLNREGEVRLDPRLSAALRGYPLPSAKAEPSSLSEETRRKLASLGYAAAGVSAVSRAIAPKPRDMTHLFDALDLGSRLFVEGKYSKAIGLFERVAAEDPENLMVQLRLAVAHSVLGLEPMAADYFERARRIAPDSTDVRHYHGMHLLRSGRWSEAEPLLESVIAVEPRRLPALLSLAEIRRLEGRLEEAGDLLERADSLNRSRDVLLKLGDLRMAVGRTDEALRAFESALALSREAEFPRYLELGVLYLATRDFEASRDALDRVRDDHPDYAMAIFKRAQVGMLLGEESRLERVASARRLATERGDQAVLELIENEPLFAIQ